MPRDKNRPRPFRGTFSFHLPAAKELLLLLLLVVVVVVVVVTSRVSAASPPVTFSTRIIRIAIESFGYPVSWSSNTCVYIYIRMYVCMYGG